MPTTLPQSVREHMGEQVAADFSRWFAENVQQELVTNDEYHEVLSRLDIFEKRFDQTDERLDRMDERLNQMDERLDAMNAQMNERFDAMSTRMDERFGAMNERMDERFDAMNARMDERSEQVTDQLDRMNDRILFMTRWLIGLLVFFGSMVTALLAVAQFGG